MQQKSGEQSQRVRAEFARREAQRCEREGLDPEYVGRWERGLAPVEERLEVRREDLTDLVREREDRSVQPSVPDWWEDSTPSGGG